jgi:hypothetical protein
MPCYTFYFIWKLLYMFQVVAQPIIRSANNCIYSVWYLSQRYWYLLLQRQVEVTYMFVVAGSCRQSQTYIKPEAVITVFELVMMSGVSLETCWAIKKHWNNKFYYTVVSCCFFLRDLYYDARIHEHRVCKLGLHVGTCSKRNHTIKNLKL